MGVDPKKDTRSISDLLKEMGVDSNKDEDKKPHITFETLQKLNKKLSELSKNNEDKKMYQMMIMIKNRI